MRQQLIEDFVLFSFNPAPCLIQFLCVFNLLKNGDIDSYICYTFFTLEESREIGMDCPQSPRVSSEKRDLIDSRELNAATN